MLTKRTVSPPGRVVPNRATCMPKGKGGVERQRECTHGPPGSTTGSSGTAGRHRRALMQSRWCSPIGNWRRRWWRLGREGANAGLFLRLLYLLTGDSEPSTGLWPAGYFESEASVSPGLSAKSSVSFKGLSCLGNDVRCCRQCLDSGIMLVRG